MYMMLDLRFRKPRIVDISRINGVPLYYECYVIYVCIHSWILCFIAIPIPPPCGSPEQSPRVSPLPPTHSPKSSAKKQPDQQSSPNKIHRTEVEGEVADGFLQKVAENIGRDWSRLGLRLGIEFRTLEQIRNSVPYDLRQQAYLMLVQWKETHKTVATMVELQDKLDELKLGRIGRLSRTWCILIIPCL